MRMRKRTLQRKRRRLPEIRLPFLKKKKKERRNDSRDSLIQ